MSGPEISGVDIHGVVAAHVEVDASGTTTWLALGPITVHATPEELIAIGGEIVRQAAALQVDQRIDQTIDGGVR